MKRVSRRGSDGLKKTPSKRQLLKDLEWAAEQLRVRDLLLKSKLEGLDQGKFYILCFPGVSQEELMLIRAVLSEELKGCSFSPPKIVVVNSVMSAQLSSEQE